MQILSGQTLDQFIADCKENVALLKENNPHIDYIAFKVTGVALDDIRAIAEQRNEPITTIRGIASVTIPTNENMFFTITS